MEAKPQWAVDNNLEASGLHYEGFVNDFQSVLSKHQMSIMTTYGTPRRSRNCADKGCSDDSKENNDGVSSNVTTYIYLVC